MKGPQAAMLMWVANLAVLAGGGALGFYVFSSSNAELDDTFVIPKVKEKAPAAINWLEDYGRRTETSLNGLSAGRLSPSKRPVKPVEPPVKPPDPPAPKEPTDDELKAELATWVNSKFKLIRTISGSSQEDSAAFIQVAELGASAPLVYLPAHYDPQPTKERIQDLPPGPTYFPTYFDVVSDSKLKQLAQYKMKVVRIESDFVLFNMPSIKREKKFFDVKLTFGNDLLSKFAMPDIGAKSTRPSSTPAEPSKLPVPPVDPRKPVVEGPVKPIFDPEDPVYGKSKYDAKTDTWDIGYEDFKSLSGDDFVKYAKVVVDNDGQPMGIQITEDVPDDHVVVKRGGQKGDIVKSVNGKAVKSMADVRKIVKTDYDAGVTSFEVVFERNGVPGRKTFKAPKKK
ncbi:MAG: hypothetical protein IT462_01735 [Planctomycetes bacterium]|nr:hypothetical protein [Planctomycetota bacterium]